MENRSCKLCVKSFTNGRALGGHMRSHVPSKTEHETEYSYSPESPTPAAPPPEIDERELLGYGLRENPRKSVKLVDQEFNSVVLQDRESETETSKNKNPVRRRSKRIRKPETSGEPETKRRKPGRPDQANSVEPEPVSSVSDATTEEDVAYCLMMLSRDKWNTREQNQIISSQYDDVEEGDETEDEEEEEEEDLDEDLDEELDEEIDEIAKYKKTQKAAKGKYKCETCYKVFKSYQALGGHRASHKKNRAAMVSISSTHHETEASNGEKIHECPVCFRVFSSGQALGGHKRSHVLGSSASNIRAPTTSRFAESLIDLNLPAPVDDDEYSQFEVSAVSDAEFVNSIKH